MSARSLVRFWELFAGGLLLVGCGGASDTGLYEPVMTPSEQDGGGGSGGSAGTGSGNACDMEGTWATFVEVGVEWQSATINPGAGTTKQWIISERTREADGRLLDRARACGIGAFNVPLGSPWFSIMDIPTLNIINEWTGVEWLPQLFDSGFLPTVELYSTITPQVPGVATPGDGFATEAKSFTFGADGMESGAPWPDIAGMAPFLADQDDDGNPGMTALPRIGAVPGAPDATFSSPRLDVNVVPVTRAAQLHMVIRTQAGLEGTLRTCDPTPRVEGSVAEGTLQIDTRTVNCAVESPTGEVAGPCTPAHISFIDANLPQFQPNGTSVMVSIKVPEGTTCAEVREMDFGLPN